MKRSYQLNQYTITKTNSITLSAPSQPSPCFSLPSLLLYKTLNSFTGKSKLLLKVVIVSPTAKSKEEQKRFGFTFMIHHQYQHQQQQDDAKFALAPDSLVKEALATWINSQNEQHQRQSKRDASTSQAPFLVSYLHECVCACVLALTKYCKITNSHYCQNRMKS